MWQTETRKPEKQARLHHKKMPLVLALQNDFRVLLVVPLWLT
jgi:hypothetical protein